MKIRFLVTAGALALATLPAVAQQAPPVPSDPVQAARQGLTDDKALRDAQERRSWQAIVALDEAHTRLEAELREKIKWWETCDAACHAWATFPGSGGGGGSGERK